MKLGLKFVIGIVTPRKTKFEDLAKKENSLAMTITNGFMSAKADRTNNATQHSSRKEFKDQSEDSATTRPTSDMARTLTNYMPKMKFLQKEYKSVRSISNVPLTARDSDAMDQMFELGERQASKELFYPFRMKQEWKVV